MSKANPRVREIIREMCAGNSSLAADVLDEEFVIIAKADLPECKVADRDGETHVDCGSDWGTWNVKHLARMRETALEYVAAWQTAEAWNSKQAVLAREQDSRRDELARELVSDGAYAYRFAEEPLKTAIDRIIALEQAA